jgi:hypothetical protein
MRGKVMNGNIDLNLTKVKQSSPEEEITEPNDSETDDTTLIESENELMQEGGAVLIADGTIDPGRVKEEVSTEPEIIV